MPTSRKSGFSLCVKPGYQCAELDKETVDLRSVCGRTARAVHGEGRVRARPYPYGVGFGESDRGRSRASSLTDARGLG